VAKAARHWMQAVLAGGRPRTRVVFVVGSQRSGTRLPIQIMDQSPQIATYSEGTAPFFDGVLLEPLDRVRTLVASSPAPIIALKPICETHRVHELLDAFPGSKAIWIFRHYEDTVNSASVKWTSGRDSLRRLAVRDLQGASWRAGGLSEHMLALATRLYHDDMSLHEANAVMWYLRNALFFELAAGARPDILLVRYEDLVNAPHEHFGRVFEFIGAPVPAAAVEAIRSSGRGRRAFPEISPEIRKMCEQLHGRLLAHYAAHDATAAPIEAGRALTIQ
jgi:hypothetical protein